MRRGFSIIEMLTVLFLIGVLASIAVPRFANMVAHQRAEAAARRIAVDLTLAQRRARVSSTKHCVRFNLAEDSYALEQFVNEDWAPLPHPDHLSLPYVVSLADEPYNALVVSADFGGNKDILFDGYGVPNTGGSVVIQSAGYSKTIVVDQDSGRVYVQ